MFSKNFARTISELFPFSLKIEGKGIFILVSLGLVYFDIEYEQLKLLVGLFRNVWPELGALRGFK